MSLTACLIDKDAYNARNKALSDSDGDGFSTVDGDCDDNASAVHPNADETCDGVDEDCNGVVDDDPLDGDTWYQDLDGDGAGDLQQQVLGCDPPDARWVATPGDCDDSDADISPSSSEIPYDGIDQNCDGADLVDQDGDGENGTEGGGDDCDDLDEAVNTGAAETWENGLTDNNCDGTFEPLSYTYGTATWYGAYEDARLGPRLAPLADVDGDGTTEFLTATIRRAEPGDYAGAVYLLGQSAPGAVVDLPRVDAPAAYSGLGASLSAGPDLDGDGIPDFATSATMMDDGAGRAFIISTGQLLDERELTVPDDTLLSIQGDQANSYFGTQAIFLPDLDGDGVAELAVSTPFASVEGEDIVGSVRLFAATSTGSMVAGDADRIWAGEFADHMMGNRVQALGDQNGDGYEDVLISGEYGIAATVIQGEAPSGRASDGALTIIYTGDELEAADPAVIGDVDGDGTLDLAILDDRVRFIGDVSGAVTRNLTDTYPSLTSGDGSLFYVAEDLGDRDGDGLAETLVTIPRYASQETAWAGILPGAAVPWGGSLLATDFVLQAIPQRADSFLGQRARAVGDVDGDGRDDIALGGFDGDEGASNSGSVALLTIPE
jgi:hypothetical protein